MSVLVTGEVRGQTKQGFDGMLAKLRVHLEYAPGFVFLGSHPTEDGWRVMEVWESKVQSDKFFATFVAPNLPSGIRPKRTVQNLHGVVLPADISAMVQS